MNEEEINFYCKEMKKHVKNFYDKNFNTDKEIDIDEIMYTTLQKIFISTAQPFFLINSLYDGLGKFKNGNKIAEEDREKTEFYYKITGEVLFFIDQIYAAIEKFCNFKD